MDYQLCSIDPLTDLRDSARIHPLSKNLMEVNSQSILSRVVINFKERKIEMYGEDGEVRIEQCSWDDIGRQQFENMVNFCQNTIPAEMRTYEL